MKAIAAPGYGPLESLRVVDIPEPHAGRGEVVVRVIASALNPADYKVVTGTLKIVHAGTKPLFVGYDFSGVVDEVGPDVSALAVGDEVFGFLPYSMKTKRGAFTERVIARVDEVAKKPASISHLDAAASATTGVTAIQSLRDLGRAKAGARVVVTGASGGVGAMTIGVAKRLDLKVTAVGSGAGLARARELGADAVVDRTQGNFVNAIGAGIDVVFDPSAQFRARTFRSVLAKGGAFVTTLPSLAFAADKLASLFSSTHVEFIAVKPRAADLALLARWLGEGLAVPIASTIDVKDVAAGLARLRDRGGRVAVRVDGGF
jgi:NADPH:quinone reductase-like Zn-dependent oxidoreductase